MPSPCGGPEGTFPFTHLFQDGRFRGRPGAGRAAWRGAQPFLKSPGPSFKMNLYKAYGINPNLLINLSVLLGLVSLHFFLSVCLADGGKGKGVRRD